MSSKKKEIELLNILASDQSEGQASAIIREAARSQLDAIHQKKLAMRAWSVNVLLVIGIIVVISAFFYYPKYRWVATLNNRAICEVTPQDRLDIPFATIAEYGKDAAINAYTYDYLNYRDRINDTATRWFTKDGQKAFMESLDTSGNLKRVIDGRYILRAMAVKVPQVEEEGVKGARRFWVVRVPIQIEFYTGGNVTPKSTLTYLASITVIQTPASALNQKGIGVDAISISPYSPTR